MARVPDALCAGSCGKMLYGSNTSLPAGQRMCRACRSAAQSERQYVRQQCAQESCTNIARRRERHCSKHYYQGPNRPECLEAACSRKVHARHVCKMHYRRVARAEGLEPSSRSWTEAKRNRYHEKRTTTPRRGDPVVLAALIERDGLMCSWCEQPIDLTLTWPNNMYRTIDHVIPVSKGGEHSLENTRLLHFACNSSRGNRAA